MGRTYTVVERLIMRLDRFILADGFISQEERDIMEGKFVKCQNLGSDNQPTGEQFTLNWLEFNYKIHHGLYRCNAGGDRVNDYTGKLLG